MKSWLGYLFPYVRSLEKELALARAERGAILDRLIRVTTGWGMDQEMPDILTAQKEAEEASRQVRGARTVFDLTREMERLSLEEAEEQRQAAEKEKAN